MKKRIAIFLSAIMLSLTVFQFVQPPEKASATLLPLWSIYQAAQYNDALEKGDLVPGSHSTEETKNSLPITGDKYSSKDLKRNGKVVQRRYYDKDGKADVDIDYDHSNGDGTHTFPHRHKWTWPEGAGAPYRGPGY